MSSDSLFVSQQPATETKPSHVELLASGNATLEGRTYYARSDTISYDGFKKLFILRSKGNRKATIWRQERIGGELKNADAQRMEFIPSKNELSLFQTSGAQGLQ